MASVQITRTVQIVDPNALVPASGYASLILPAYGHRAANPGSMSDGNFDEALFEAFGSGVYVKDFSSNGAYVIAASGGHGHFEVVGATYVDFTTPAWGFIPVPGYVEDGAASQLADTNGAPWYELNGFPNVPAPAHPYAMLDAVSIADGGGTKGSVVYIGRAAVTGGAYGAQSVHRLDLASGAWSRAVPSEVPFGTAQEESSSVFDPVAKRYYRVPGYTLHYLTRMPYIDATTWTYGQTAQWSAYPKSSPTGYAKGCYLEVSGYRLLIVFWGTMWQALDLDNPTAGFRELTKGGESLSITSNVPVEYPPDGCLYYRASSGAGNTLKKITPPADPFAGTWTVSTVTLLGDTIPEFIGGNISTNAYRSLFYIPSFQCFGWVTAFGVALIKP